MPKFYAVGRGKVPGIYTNWDKCQEQVLGFSKAQSKKFGNFEEARAFVHQYNPSLQLSNSSSSDTSWLLSGSTRNDQNHSASGSKGPEVSLGAKRIHVRSGFARNGSTDKAKAMEVVDEERPRKRMRRSTVSAEGPLAAFSAPYTKFKYNPAASATDEFHRLCRAYRWRNENDLEKRLAKQRFQNALTPQFNDSYGTKQGPLATFFAQYSKFKYNPAASATDEFHRLCRTYGWQGRNDQEKLKKQLAKQGFQDALTLQFNANYGTDVDDLNAWQALCTKLGMNPVPESLDVCREYVRHTHVNLVDLVDIFDTPKTAHLFPSVFALSEYTKEHWKSFPRRNIHAGSLLKFLLRQILNPELDDR